MVARDPFTREGIDQCRREISAIENQLRAGHPELHGLLLALADWSVELRILLGASDAPVDPPSAETGNTS